MERECDHCGKTFVAKRASAKFCSSSCRGQATKRRQSVDRAQVVDLAMKREGPADPDIVAEAAEDPLVAGYRARLASAGKSGTHSGQHALFLARRLAASSGETGSAVAALSKELDRLMVSILADVKPEPDELDGMQAEVLQMRTSRRA